jgi:hypothetical protein
MRPSSFHQPLNRSEKEKVMRKSFAAIALVAAVALATPATAAPRERDRSTTPVVKMLLKYAQKMFGIRTTADPIIPIPAPSTSGKP